VINWKVLLGILVALTVVLFSSILLDLTSSRDQAQVMINNINTSAQRAQDTNDKLIFLLDSITKESEHLETRVAFLEAQKDSLTKRISRASIGLKAKSGIISLTKDYYMNCGNMVHVDVPKQYSGTKLKYSSDDARILETPERGRIIIFPLQRIVHIIIESEGTVINKLEFPNIKNVPEPEFQVYHGNQKIDFKRGAIGKTLSSLSVVAEPEPNFLKAVPKDARYLTKRWELKITRGSSVILKRVCNSESVDLNAERSRLKRGDIVHISEMSFARINFHDKPQMFFPTEVITFPIL
jgi:hypothetical protein